MSNEFTRLKIKLILRIIGSVALAAIVAGVVIVLVLDGFLQDPVANLASRLGLYSLMVRNKITFIVIMVVAFILMGVYIAMNKLSYYLKSVSKGIDQVFDKTVSVIQLPDGLKAMETKLNTVKYDLQQKEFEAKQSEQQKNDLVVYLAHDLRTPLTSILGYLSLMTTENDLPEQARSDYSNIVYDKAKRMEMLLDELFEITRFNAQKMELIKRKVNLNMMLEQLAEEFYPLLMEKDLVCRIITEDVVFTTADSDQLARVFDNLLRNALSYSESGSEILIRLYRDDQSKARISFTNYGITIPAEKLERIFEKFYRADEARSSTSGGAGLGLAIARTIVEMHEGTIEAQSENLETTFTVTLPALSKKDEPENDSTKGGNSEYED